jgi:multidrug efflux pump subunit AcrA (membrane-fusion protein)
MSAWRPLLSGLMVISIGVALVVLYGDHRVEAERESRREEPIVAASRVRQTEAGPVVVLDSAESRRVGLETAVLEPASAAAPHRLVGEVVDEPERTASLRAPLSGRLTLPQDGRWPSLGDRLSQGETLARVSDARPLTAPLTGTVTRVGARPGEIVESGQLLLELVDRSRPVVRVVWIEAAGAPRQTVVLAPPGGGARLNARLIGPAAEADPLTRRPAYLYRADRSWPGSTPGTVVSAMVPSGGSEVRGALVPDRAVVQWDGLTWAYRRVGRARFERRPVSPERPVAGGWIVTGGLSAGDTVVVTGAQELLSEEFRSRVTVGDESGE